MHDEKLKDVVNQLGTNFNVGMFMENMDTLKTIDAYREALDGAINGRHSFQLLRALTHNLITDFKRYKVKTTEYGSIDTASEKLRRTNFTLQDAFTALCEVTLDQDECNRVEKQDEMLWHFISLVASSMRLNEDLHDYLTHADDLLHGIERDLEELSSVEERAGYLRANMCDFIDFLLPTPVSDVGDFADGGSYSCGAFLSKVKDTLEVMGEECKKLYEDNFSHLISAITYYKDECSVLLKKAEDFAYDNESFTDEEMVEFMNDVSQVTFDYIRSYSLNNSDDLIIDCNTSEGTSLGEDIANLFNDKILNPIYMNIRYAFIKTNNGNPEVNAFDEEDIMSIVMSLITAKLNLHDKMTLAMDGDMSVSYDGSSIDEDLHGTVNNIYHEKESEDEINPDREVPMADILSNVDMSEGWVYSVFNLYKNITENIRYKYID